MSKRNKQWGAAALGVGAAVGMVLAACSTSPASSQSGSAPTAQTDTPAGPTADPRMNPTAAVGGGVNTSSSASSDELTSVFGSVPQSGQLKITASSNPAGARGEDVSSITITAQDTGEILKSMDANAKKSLADAMLNAAGTAWPKATISLLLSAPAGGGQVIGTRVPGGPNTVFVT
jgi:hypothetical protein